MPEAKNTKFNLKNQNKKNLCSNKFVFVYQGWFYFEKHCHLFNLIFCVTLLLCLDSGLLYTSF